MENLLLSAFLFTGKSEVETKRNRRISPYVIEKIQEKNTVYSAYQRKTLEERNRDFFKARTKKKKPTTFIIAPHPDDEVLCCSETINQKIEEGESVKVIFITDGDAYVSNSAQKSRQYAKKRKQESKTVARKLGLKQSDLFFLGFPDSYISKLKPQKITTSKYTKKQNAGRGSYFPFARYTQTELVKNLQEIFRSHNVSQVYLPSQKDTHPDHTASANIVKTALSQSKQKAEPEILEYQIHGRRDRIGEIVSDKKLFLIQFFKSQFHDKRHKSFLEKFAFIPEQFLQANLLLDTETQKASGNKTQ